MICFRVDGECVPKGRPRVTRGGHAFTPKKTKDYEEKVRLSFLAESSKTLPHYKDEAVIVYITIHQQIPKAFSKKKIEAALNEEIVPINHKADIDNQAKSILDSLNGYAFADDCQVQKLIVRKIYSLTASAEVMILSRAEAQEIRL